MSVVRRHAMGELHRGRVNGAKGFRHIAPQVGTVSFVHRAAISLNLRGRLHVMLIHRVRNEHGSLFEPAELPTPGERQTVFERIGRRVVR